MFENVVTLPCIWFSHPFLIASCTRLPIQPQYYICIPQGTSKEWIVTVWEIFRVQVEETWAVEWRQRPYQFHVKTGTSIKGAPSHTHFPESRGCWSGLRTWRQKLSSPVLMGWGLHALVASSLSHEAFQFSKDHMESNRWKKMNHRTWAYEKRRQRSSDPQRIPHIGKEVEWEVYWISRYKVVLLQKEKKNVIFVFILIEHWEDMIKT